MHCFGDILSSMLKSDGRQAHVQLNAAAHDDTCVWLQLVGDKLGLCLLAACMLASSLLR